jgi:hypothetical protein
VVENARKRQGAADLAFHRHLRHKGSSVFEGHAHITRSFGFWPSTAEGKTEHYSAQLEKVRNMVQRNTPPQVGV